MPENSSGRSVSRPADHVVSKKLVAQRGLFHGPNPICPLDLYLKVEAGAAARERHRVVVRARSRVTTDTYFGRFPASHWQRWTVVDRVDLELVVTGSGRLTLVASDATGRTRMLAARTLEDLDDAAEDFLAGPAILRDGGAAAAAEVRTLRARYPDTVVHKPTSMPGLRPGEAPLTPAGPTPSMPRAVLLKRLVHLAMGKTVHRIGAVPEQDGAWWHVSLFDTAVVTDAAQDGVRLRKRDRRTVLRLAMRAARIARRLITETPDVRREYRAAMPELAARENWARLFGL